MLRRIGIAIRWSLLVLGVAALVLLPVSFFVLPEVSMPVPRDRTRIYVMEGALHIDHLKSQDPLVYSAPWRAMVHENPGWPINWSWVFRPVWQSVEYTISGFSPQTSRMLIVPLWMIAAASLAWPVLAWRAARRRRRRGFDVTLVDDAGEGNA